MSKSKLLCLAKILLDYTDDNHGLSCDELICELKNYNITAERKSIYSDVKVLQSHGLDIIKQKHGRAVYYSIGMRKFELAELKLMMDAVQASKSISEKKSQMLLEKLGSLASKYDAGELHRQAVESAGRVKAINENVLYNIDIIEQAIRDNRKITFQYYQWTIEKKLEQKHDNKIYLISPWDLQMDNEKYYLIGYDSEKNMKKHFSKGTVYHY